MVLVMTLPVVQEEWKCGHGSVSKGQKGKRDLQTENMKSNIQLIVNKGLLQSQCYKS